MMKPDWRYLNVASIGFCCPRALPFRAWRTKYGQSRGVPREEGAFMSQHKQLCIGKVKSYGSVTCIQTTAGLGAQGSPVFNELGKCWGLLIGSYNDVPAKMADDVHVPDPLKMPGGGKLAEVPLTTRELKRKRRKEKKREKKRREKERKKREKERLRQRQKEKDGKQEAGKRDEVDPNEESQNEKEDEVEAPGDEQDEQDLHPLEMPRIDSDNTDSNASQDAEQTGTRIEDNNLLGDSYFDVKSDHCLMPLLPQ